MTCTYLRHRWSWWGQAGASICLQHSSGARKKLFRRCMYIELNSRVYRSTENKCISPPSSLPTLFTKISFQLKIPEEFLLKCIHFDLASSRKKVSGKVMFDHLGKASRVNLPHERFLYLWKEIPLELLPPLFFSVLVTLKTIRGVSEGKNIFTSFASTLQLRATNAAKNQWK